MKQRKVLLPLLGTALLILFCTVLPFGWFEMRDRQLDASTWRTEPSGDFLSAAGQENPVARELYFQRQQTNNTLPYEQPAESPTAREDVQPYLAALRSGKVLPVAYLDAADALVSEATQCLVGQTENGETAYYFTSEDYRSLTLTVSPYGTLTNLNGELGLTDGFIPAEVAKAYRTMLGLDSFTDWEDAEPAGYGAPAPCYSTDAQLYLVANMDRGYFSLSVTSMAPETYAGL